jgi:hypothetical protein
MQRGNNLLDVSGPPGAAEQRVLEAEKRRRLNADARRIYLETMKKRRAARESGADPAIDEARLKVEVQRRFKLANPSSTEADFEAYWLTVLDEIYRQRAQQALEQIKERLRTSGSYAG